MLSIARVPPGGERYYFRTAGATAEEPLGLVEPDPYWLGRGAAALGLDGRAGRAKVRALFAGVDPLTGEVLAGGGTARVRNVAYDLTLSVPKSVSIVHALSDPEMANPMQEAHRRAVAATVGYLEEGVLCARRSSPSGRWQVGVEGALACAFVHRTSRAGDPHLHAHVLVANLALGDDGRWTALDSRPLFRAQRPVRALFEAVVRHELSALGIEFGPIRRDFADIASIDRRTIDEFSRQSRLIAERMREEGLHGPKAAALLAGALRPEKDVSRPYAALQAEWRERSFRVGLSPTRLAVAAGRGGRPAARPDGDGGRRHDGAAEEVAWAESVRYHPDGTFSRSDLVVAYCTSRRHGAGADEIEAAVTRALERPGVVAAGTPGRYTTKSVQDHLARTAGVVGELGHATAASVIAYEGRGGRRTALEAASRLAPANDGGRVFALAPGPRAARAFEEGSGITTYPVKSLRAVAPRVGIGDVLVLAESGAMLEGEITASLELCRGAGASAVLFGSERSMERNRVLDVLRRESPVLHRSGPGRDLDERPAPRPREPPSAQHRRRLAERELERDVGGLGLGR